MTKIYVDNSSLKNNLMVDANNALKQLKKSIYDVGRINVPYEFEYSEYVKKIFDKNLKTYNNLYSEIEKINSKVQILDSIEKNNIENINNVKIVDINYRKNMIN